MVGAMSTDSIASVRGYFRHEGEKVRGSRFIVTVDRCDTEAQMQAVLLQVREEFPDANHHCYGWRGAHEHQQRCSDDGEPYGSAGIPILKALEGRELKSTVVVVTRYFGGTKLGVGGLVRAYGGSAAQALDLTDKEVRAMVRSFEISFEYTYSGAVESQRNAFGATVVNSTYTEQVLLQVEVAQARADAFIQAIRDACRGNVTIREIRDGAK